MSKILLFLLSIALCSCNEIIKQGIDGNVIKIPVQGIIVPSEVNGNCNPENPVEEMAETLKALEKEPAFTIQHQKEVDSLWTFQVSAPTSAKMKMQISIYDEEGFEIMCPYDVELKSKKYSNAILVNEFEKGVYITKFQDALTSASRVAKFTVKK